MNHVTAQTLIMVLAISVVLSTAGYFFSEPIMQPDESRSPMFCQMPSASYRSRSSVSFSCSASLSINH